MTSTGRIPSSPPDIEPVNAEGKRPLWSVMIPAYNCSLFLRETLKSVLSQDKGLENMQIEVIDDCSTDNDVALLVNEIGKGRVKYFRQQQNVGSLRNFETCLKRSRGEFIHLLHGDDQVNPGFYTEIEHLFKDYPAAGAAVTGFSGIDENGEVMYSNKLLKTTDGIIDDWLIKISENQRLQACAVVVKRKVYEAVGGFFGVEYGEDWEMWVRIAARFPFAYSPKNLALYRHHNNNISARFLSSGKNIQDLKKVIETVQQYLPIEKRSGIKKNARRNFSRYFAGNALGIYKKHHNGKVALKQARGALLLDFNKYTFMALLKLMVKVLINHRSNK